MLTIEHTEVSYDKVDVPVCICLHVDQCDEQTVHITIINSTSAHMQYAVLRL